jgi:hypothetical protein
MRISFAVYSLAELLFSCCGIAILLHNQEHSSLLAVLRFRIAGMENPTFCTNGRNLYKGLHSSYNFITFPSKYSKSKSGYRAAGKLQEFDDVWAFGVGSVAVAPFAVMAGAAALTLKVVHLLGVGH